MDQQIRALSLGDMFDRTFRILGSTFVRNLTVGVIVFLPGTLLIAFGLNGFTASISDLILHHDPAQFGGDAFENFDWQLLTPFIWSILLMMLGVMVFSLGSLLAGLAMMRTAASAVEGNVLDWDDALRQVSGAVWMRSIGQAILMGLAVGGVFLLPYILLLIGAGTGFEVLLGIGIIGILGAIPIVIWLAIRWQFCQTVIAVEDDTVMHSFSRSSFLVREYWWRTLGILICFSLAGSFAIQIVTAPLALIAMWGFFSGYFQIIMNASHGTEPSPEIIVSMIRSLGLGYAVFIAVSTLLTQMFTSVYLVVMYYDLRARKGEFPDPAVSAPQPANGETGLTFS